jgi:peroxiredoxin
MKIATAAELGFVFLTATAVYLFVSVARDSETRRACVPVCAMRPSYAGRNRIAPDFALTGLDGRRMRLSDFRGKAIVLNFWTSTCPPCIEEMPSLGELAKVVAKRKDVVVLTVSTDPDQATAKNTVESATGGRTPFPVLLDPESSIVGEAFGTRLFPETWLIDKSGIIRARFDGARDWANPLMLELIDSLAVPMSCDIDFVAGSANATGERICDDVLSSG